MTMNSKLAQTIYQLGTVIAGVLGIALIWGGIDAGSAANIGQIIAGITALIPGAASGTAAVRVGKQRANGTLDASPVDQVLGGLSAITGAQATAAEVAAQAADDLAKVTTAITGAIGGVPVIGPALGAQVGALTQQVIDAARPR